MREKVMYFKKKYKKETSLFLFAPTYLYTLVLLFMLIWDSINSNFKTPEGLIYFYIWGLLSPYVILKEQDRWIHRVKWEKRSGHNFVYLWIFTLLGLYVAEYLSHGRISPPSEMINVVLYVITIFSGSLISKYAHERMSPQRNLPLAFYDYDKLSSQPSKLIIKQRIRKDI